MLVRLLDVQAEGAVVCRSSQVGTIGGAATEAHRRCCSFKAVGGEFSIKPQRYDHKFSKLLEPGASERILYSDDTRISIFGGL